MLHTETMSHRPLAARPTAPTRVPRAVRAIAGGATVEPVWRNELGGLTFRVGGAAARFVKWSPAGVPGLDLAAEVQRLAWVDDRAAVPRVLDSGADDEGGWLVTAAIPAASAVEPRWLDDPQTAVRAIGHGLRRLHDSLPVDECPFEWSVARRLAQADVRIAAGMTVDDWFPEHRGTTVAEARRRLTSAPPVDRLVVCHGDPCAPNTLIDDDGRFAAHVDLGSLGVADRWADIAVAAWSTEWNYGPGLAPLLYESYGIDADEERIEYYRLLWDLG